MAGALRNVTLLFFMVLTTIKGTGFMVATAICRTGDRIINIKEKDGYKGKT